MQEDTIPLNCNCYYSFVKYVIKLAGGFENVKQYFFFNYALKNHYGQVIKAF